MARTIIRHLLTLPVVERGRLPHPALLVADHGVDRAAAAAPAAQPGQPHGSARQRAAERLDFADAAAGEAEFLRVAKGVDAVPRNECANLFRVGVIGADADAVARLRLRPQRVGLGKEAASIERDDLRRERVRDDRVEQCLILQPEAGGAYDAPARRPRAHVAKPQGQLAVEVGAGFGDDHYDRALRAGKGWFNPA